MLIIIFTVLVLLGGAKFLLDLRIKRDPALLEAATDNSSTAAPSVAVAVDVAKPRTENGLALKAVAPVAGAAMV